MKTLSVLCPRLSMATAPASRADARCARNTTGDVAGEGPRDDALGGQLSCGQVVPCCDHGGKLVRQHVETPLCVSMARLVIAPRWPTSWPLAESDMLSARVRGKALHYGCAIPFVAVAAPSLSQLMHNRETGTGPVAVPSLDEEKGGGIRLGSGAARLRAGATRPRLRAHGDGQVQQRQPAPLARGTELALRGVSGGPS